MTLVQYLFETGPQDATLTNGNSGSTGGSIGAGSSTKFDAAVKAHGNFGASFTNGGGANCYRAYPFDTPATVWQFSGVFTMPTIPTGNMNIVAFSNAAGNGRVVVYVNSSGNLAVFGQSGSVVGTIATGLTPGMQYRVTLQVQGGSTTASTIVAKLYSGDGGSWVTQVGSTLTSTTANTSTDDLTSISLGLSTTMPDSYTVGWDDVQLNTGPGPELDDITPTLSTPVVTLGATTNPSTVGGSDGMQVVTWSAVSGAGSYEAWRAPGLSPAQEDFTLVAASVTSPYTFTGLAAGEHSFGIKAKV